MVSGELWGRYGEGRELKLVPKIEEQDVPGGRRARLPRMVGLEV